MLQAKPGVEFIVSVQGMFLEKHEMFLQKLQKHVYFQHKNPNAALCDFYLFIYFSYWNLIITSPARLSMHDSGCCSALTGFYGQTSPPP